MVLDRGVMVCNGKGGVGKSSLAAAIAAMAAGAGWKTLVVDLDPQGDVGFDLGYVQDGRSDGGEALQRSVLTGSPLRPIEGVRYMLDAVPAGPGTEECFDRLRERVRFDGLGALRVLYDVLAPVAANYDLVVIDTPPTGATTQDAALWASRYLLVPARFDAGSIDGMARVSDRFMAVRESAINPRLELLGVVLFAFGEHEQRMIAETRAELELVLGSLAPVFDTYIRQAKWAARHMRRCGLTPGEFRDLIEAMEASAPGPSPMLRSTAQGLVDDYAAVTHEVLSRIWAAATPGRASEPVGEVIDLTERQRQVAARA
jgi:chromosome partitioning protein